MGKTGIARNHPGENTKISKSDTDEDCDRESRRNESKSSEKSTFRHRWDEEETVKEIELSDISPGEGSGGSQSCSIHSHSTSE
jgi:hypothetical protein